MVAAIPIVKKKNDKAANASKAIGSSNAAECDTAVATLCLCVWIRKSSVGSSTQALWIIIADAQTAAPTTRMTPSGAPSLLLLLLMRPLIATAYCVGECPTSGVSLHRFGPVIAGLGYLSGFPDLSGDARVPRRRNRSSRNQALRGLNCESLLSWSATSRMPAVLSMIPSSRSFWICSPVS